MASAIEDAVTAAESAVAQEDAVDTSAETLMAQLLKLYQDALASGGTPAAVVDRVTALTAALTAKQAALSAAVVANTPAAP